MNKLLDYNIDYSLSNKNNIEYFQLNKILPLENKELSVLIATSDESVNMDALIDMFQKPVKVVQFTKKEINSELHYLDFKKELYIQASKAIANIEISSNNSYINNFMEKLFSFCITQNVSDIHFESFDNSIIIRLRIDGELKQIFRFQRELFALISSVIKYFGNLDIAQKRIPLNGRFSKKIDGMIYDMRISTMPTIYSESIVLRILDNGSIQKDINTIGFEKETLETIKKTLRLTQGLVLVTGPTGSGKTTSLYSMINTLNTVNKKIITIEDPVEYKLDGVIQVNINDEINLNYKTILKNILRQDPDILLIGEIRDSESLQIAIQASLTGHLVIATLHTNGALETITRLLDLKAESYLIASTLKMVLSQRLLRRLCTKCKEKENCTHSYIAKGCKECSYTGYKNRNVVTEVLEMDEQMSSLLSLDNPMKEMKLYFSKIQFTTLQDNAMVLVHQGQTSLEEYYSKV